MRTFRCSKGVYWQESGEMIRIAIQRQHYGILRDTGKLQARQFHCSQTVITGDRQRLGISQGVTWTDFGRILRSTLGKNSQEKIPPLAVTKAEDTVLAATLQHISFITCSSAAV